MLCFTYSTGWSPCSSQHCSCHRGWVVLYETFFILCFPLHYLWVLAHLKVITVLQRWQHNMTLCILLYLEHLFIYFTFSCWNCDSTSCDRDVYGVQKMALLHHSIPLQKGTQFSFNVHCCLNYEIRKVYLFIYSCTLLRSRSIFQVTQIAQWPITISTWL